MEGVYERTGVCPYTDECESYKAIYNSERWMERNLSRLRRAGLESLPEEDGGYSEQTLVDKLAHLRRVKGRCYGRNGRCLRFWQFEKRNEEHRSFDRLRKRMEVFGGVIGPAPSGPPVHRGEDSTLKSTSS